MKEYYIMNKDRVVAVFNESGNIKVIGRMPYGFRADSEGVFNSIVELTHWLEDRVKVMCVRNLKEFFSSIGINSVLDAVGVTNMVSLSDSFWVKDSISELRWCNVSPYRRNYSEAVSRFALDGVIDNSGKNYFSPVIGTDGSFPHTWKWKENKVVFIKGSSKYTLGGYNSGREPYSEYYASIVAQYLKFDCVKYRIRNHRRTDGNIDIVTECDCYNSETYGSVSASTLGLSKYEEVIEYCKKLGKESYERCINMLFIDCLLMNTDRHMGNIEFAIDNDSLNVLKIRPIYDNNCSLLPRFMEGVDRFDRKDYVARDGRSFDDLYKLVKAHKKYNKELAALKKFSFERPKSVAISKNRLKFLNKFMQAQVEHLYK